MGASGSGKTTLLDVLAGRKTQGTITGTVRFSGFPPTQNFLRRFTGYVEQFDTLLPVFTVREMVMYTAELKRPVSESLSSKTAASNDILAKLGLEGCKDVKIGSPLARGISGGQAKRVNIALALVSNPRVLFLDEPTSGLDSHMANEVITLVKNLTRDGTTICATVHSPTPYAFRLFDRLMILANGRTVYVGTREAATGFFETLTGDGQSLNENSEAEWITDVVVTSDREGRQTEMIEAFEKSVAKKNLDDQIDSLLEKKGDLNEAEYERLAKQRATVTPFWYGIKTFIKYRSSKNFRSPEFMVPRIAAKLVFVFLLSTIFAGVGDDFSRGNFTNIAGLIFVWTALPVFSAQAYLPSLVLERPVFYRERNDGLYRVITYLVGKMLDEVVVAIVTSIAFGLIIFEATQLQGSMVVFLAIYCGNTLVGVGIAYFIASIAPNLDAAGAMLPAYASSLILFSGFMIRLSDIPNYYYWYTRINFVQYAFSALIINQYDTPEGKDFKLMVAMDGNGSGNGVPILEYYSIDDVDKHVYTTIIFVFCAVFFLLAYIGMSFVTHQRR